MAVSDYPLLKNLTGDDYNYLVRKLPEERLNAHLISDSQAVTKLLHEFGLVDSFRIQDPVLVANVFRSLFFITMHKAELGEGSYQLTIIFWSIWWLTTWSMISARYCLARKEP
jgi:hypothetical protein